MIGIIGIIRRHATHQPMARAAQILLRSMLRKIVTKVETTIFSRKNKKLSFGGAVAGDTDAETIQRACL